MHTHTLKAKIITSICIIGVLNGCVSATVVKEGTAQQRYYAAKQDYTTVLTGVAQYVKGCRKTPTPACLKRTKQIQNVDDKLFFLFKAGDSAIVTKDEERIASYLGAISLGLSELRAYSLE